MQIKIYTFPLLAEAKEMDELNHFLRANKIIDIKKELAMMNGNSYWTFCITYMQSPNNVSDASAIAFSNKRGKVDYRGLLDETTFARFSKMRKLRKQIAEKEAIPAYAVFTDAELAELAKLEVIDMAHMLKIQGIGEKRVKKYGELFCLTDYTLIDDEESGTFNGEDS